jgi:adenosylhomocysteine nucleosidase
VKPRVVVIISADIEWKIVCNIFKDCIPMTSPFGQWFETDYTVKNTEYEVIFYHGGWGKISAAASTQYIIDQWQPSLLINLGTCGGFKGLIEVGAILLVEKTIVYDIIEQMGDFDEHIAHYTTEIDLSWLAEPFPQKIRRSLLVSGDRDLLAEDIETLHRKYGAVAADWESGAIAWVAARNNIRLLILRGVSDLVSSSGGDAYGGNIGIFEDNAGGILTELIRDLPEWIGRARLF